MNIKRVRAIYYSATGTTQKVVETLAKTLAEAFSVPFDSVSFNTPQDREIVHTCDPDEVVVVGSPTYAGKLPNKLMPTFQTNLVGNGAVAVAVVLFGNRSYDNSLAELTAILQAGGFRTVCATACVGQHAFAEALATGRPNQEDLGFVKDVARRVAERLRDGSPFADLQVPGDAAAPYYVPKDEQGQPAKFLKAHPKTDPSKCVNCGTCARLCPMGSIDPEDVTQVEGICIKCQACIRHCPTGAKYFDDPAFLSHRAMLEQNFTEPKNNEYYLA